MSPSEPITQTWEICIVRKVGLKGPHRNAGPREFLLAKSLRKEPAFVLVRIELHDRRVRDLVRTRNA